METVTIDMYNPNALVTLKRITNTESGDAQFELYKTTELEGVLDDLRRRVTNLEDWLSRSQNTIRQITDNMTLEGWYSSDVDKEDVLRDLCSILDHTPQAEMSWSVNLTVEGTTLVNLDEAEDFDIRYHLQDTLTVESADWNTKIDSWDTSDVTSQEWE